MNNDLLSQVRLSVDLGKVNAELVLHAGRSNLQHPCGWVQLTLDGGDSWHSLQNGGKHQLQYIMTLLCCSLQCDTVRNTLHV